MQYSWQVKNRWAIWTDEGSTLVDVYPTKKEALKALAELSNPERYEIGRW